MNPQKPLKLGTRGSPLALAQAHEVKAKLCAQHNWPSDQVEVVVLQTTGDRFTDRPLSAIGGKGLFTKELEEGLYSGAIDLAVHSTKDVATIIPDGLKLAAILEREDPRDAFVSLKYGAIDDLPTGSTVGTSSLRRKAQLLNKRPDLEVVEFRGQVATRLEKLKNGVAEATFLAVAGLNRLGREKDFGAIAYAIDSDEMLPAVAQGAISIEIRENDDVLEKWIAPLHDEATAFAVTAERAMLRVLDGSCRTPIAGYYEGGVLRGEVLSLDGKERLRASIKGGLSNTSPIELGEMLAKDLLAMGAANVLG